MGCAIIARIYYRQYSGFLIMKLTIYPTPKLMTTGERLTNLSLSFNLHITRWLLGSVRLFQEDYG